MALLMQMAVPALVAFGLICKQLFNYDGKNKIMYLPAWQHVVIAMFYSGALISAAASLKYKDMTLIRFLIYSYATEVVFLPLFSYNTLKRPLFLHYIPAVILAICGVLMHDIMMLSRDPLTRDVKIDTAEGYESVLLCISYRISYLLGVVTSKKFILTRAFYYKMKNYSLYRQPAFYRSEEYKQQKYYKEYFEGQEKPKLLKKDSMLYKRFEMFKKLHRMIRDIDYKMDDTNRQKLTFIKKMALAKYIKLEDLGLPPVEEKKFQFNIDMNYGTLTQKELDQIMDLDEAYMNGLIKKQGYTKFHDLKKWELDAILEQEEEEKKLLEIFLLDYKDVKLNSHMFHDKDDLVLTKLDSVFDSMAYDNEFFSIDFTRNIEIYTINCIFTVVMCMFSAFFNDEFYRQYYQQFEDQQKFHQNTKMDHKYHYIFFLVSGVFVLLKPLVIARMVLLKKKGVYFMLKLVSDYIVLMVVSIFTEVQPIYRTNQLIALGMVAFASYLNYAGENHKKTWMEFNSLIELAKTYF